MPPPVAAPETTPASPAGRVLVGLLAVAAIAGPYALRALDDNRLTSWSWVFAGRHPAALFALAAAAALLAQAVPRLLPARRREALLFLAACAVGAATWTAPEPIVDAARYFVQAKHLALRGVGHFLREWGREIPVWTDLPLVPFVQGLALLASGESRLAVEALGTLCFAGTAVVTARLGAALWDEGTGLAAGALLLAMPYLVAQVPLMLVDVPTMFLVTLALHALVRALQRGGARAMLLAAVALVLALLSKYSAALLLTAIPVAAVVLGRTARPSTGSGRAEAGTGSGRAVPALRVLLPIVLTAAGLALAWVLPHLDVHARQLSLLLGYQAPGLRRWGESFLSTFVFQVHPFVSAAALASAWLAFRRRDLRWLVAAWPLLLLVLLGVRRARYLLPAFPMLALLAAHGLGALRSRETRRLVVASAVLGALVVALHGYLPFLRTTSAMNLKEAGAYLDALPEERVEVLTAVAGAPEVNPAVSVPLLDLFTAKRLVYREEPTPRPGGPAAEKSSLRFTWELPVAPWYAPGPPHPNPSPPARAGGEGLTAPSARPAGEGLTVGGGSAPSDRTAGEGPSPGGSSAIVVISDGAAELPPRVVAALAGHVLERTFDAHEDVFGHRTRVLVYRRP